MSWTNQQKIFSLETYFATKSYQSVQIQFRKRFHCRNFPSKSTIVSWVKKFREHGTVVDLCSKATGGTYSGRKKSARTEENIAAVRDSVGRSPRKSVRRRSQELGMTRESLRRVLTSDLHLYPYKIQIKQKLTDADKEKRVTMCEWFCNVLENDENFLDNVWFSNEAHFLLSGHVNSKNNIFWGSRVPEEVLQRPLHSVKCTAWVAMSKHGIIGPFWFEDDDGRSQTVNKERYITVLNKYWASLGRRRGVLRASQWFQQDGATPHTANETIAWLRQRFEERLISRRCDVEWAPHSPDLNPPDFYLWGFLKDNVYQGNPQTIEELKTAITEKIRASPKEECIKVIQNFARRVQVCLQRNGGHLEHILGKP